MKVVEVKEQVERRFELVVTQEEIDALSKEYFAIPSSKCPTTERLVETLMDGAEGWQ